jgi:hypothetical protein
MINNDRIVPITKIDLLSFYGLVLVLTGGESAPAKLDAIDTEGDFVQNTNSATVLCSEPVKSFNFGSSATAGTVYFIPALDYAGFTKTGATLTIAGATVEADGRTLYSATLSSGTLTFAKIGF